MSVRAKFTVTSAVPYPTVGPVAGVTVSMMPVYSTDPKHENKAFWDATPGGSISLTITNPAAFERFVQGKEYYVDFTVAEPANG